MARTAFLLICLIGLAGCEAMAVTFVGANMATLMHADKTIPDIVLSRQHGKNCSLLHAERNQPYCQSEPPDPRESLAALAATRYCYRTLGGIDCYERPDFLASGHSRVHYAAGFLPAQAQPAPVALRHGVGSAMAGIPASAEPVAAPRSANPPMSSAVKSAAPEGAAATGGPATGAARAKAPTPAIPPTAEVPPLAALPGQGTY